ncbi:MAG: hypothetical protein WCA89_16615, partial [Terracidiphilus sp.]
IRLFLTALSLFQVGKPEFSRDVYPYVSINAPASTEPIDFRVVARFFPDPPVCPNPNLFIQPYPTDSAVDFIGISGVP